MVSWLVVVVVVLVVQSALRLVVAVAATTTQLLGMLDRTQRQAVVQPVHHPVGLVQQGGRLLYLTVDQEAAEVVLLVWLFLVATICWQVQAGAPQEAALLSVVRRMQARLGGLPRLLCMAPHGRHLREQQVEGLVVPELGSLAETCGTRQGPVVALAAARLRLLLPVVLAVPVDPTVAVAVAVAQATAPTRL